MQSFISRGRRYSARMACSSQVGKWAGGQMDKWAGWHVGIEFMFWQLMILLAAAWFAKKGSPS
jgi:hypothetical protein